MSPEQFAYWLQGFAELNPAPPTAEQWQTIRDHIATVFEKVTPRRIFDVTPVGEEVGLRPRILPRVRLCDSPLTNRRIC